MVKKCQEKKALLSPIPELYTGYAFLRILMMGIGITLMYGFLRPQMMGDILTAVAAYKVLLTLADTDERLKTQGPEPLTDRVFPIGLICCYIRIKAMSQRLMGRIDRRDLDHEPLR